MRCLGWLTLGLGLLGCAGEREAPRGEDGPLAEKALDATEDHFWIYDGGLSPLDAWRVTFSLRGHTARVSGLLPDGWRRPLPSYAVERPGPAGRREVHVVYPVSTAGPGSSNADPGRYRRLASWSHTPSNVSNEGVSWGGFPYLEFDAGRNIAFHGPISVELQQQRPVWRLQRGAVSHGCARMQGEHVVELAHLVGLDMGVPEELDVTFGTSEEGDFLVEVLEGYDAFEGAVVDVDYPAATGFERPTGEGVRVFSTWSSDDHPRFVCAHEPDRTLGEGHCGHLEAATRSSVRAVDLGRVECPAPFVALPVGTEGGVVCSDGARAVGPRGAGEHQRLD